MKVWKYLDLKLLFFRATGSSSDNGFESDTADGELTYRATTVRVAPQIQRQFAENHYTGR